MNEPLVAETQIEKTIAALTERGIQTELVQTGQEAFQRLQALIPAGVSLSAGASLTLKQIGFEDLLTSGNHPWNNLRAGILAEPDRVKQMRLRRESTLADYYLGSPQAITESGELVFASAGGSQLPAFAFSSKHVIWVAGIQKIVPTLEDALKRIREYALPIEDERAKSVGMPGSFIGKLLIFERENERMGREIRLILVNETLGV